MYQVIDLHSPGRRPLLERVIFRGIVFNMSWEDPEMDRRAFQVAPGDAVLSITSAGCNPLNLLCEGPRELISVDGNPAQNAVLELKLAALLSLDHDAFYDIFAARAPQRVRAEYAARLRRLISPRARRFWDSNLRLVERGIYRYGRIGLFCRILRAYMRVRGISVHRERGLFDCKTLDEQKEYYEKHIAPRLWGRRSRRLVMFRPFIYLAGVHPNQFNLVDGRHDMYDYVRERVEYVLTQVPIRDNYFLSVATTGQFQEGHVPPYLRLENFDALRERVGRVRVVNGWLGPCLDSLPEGSVQKFNLLDIFDWMSPEQFENTMRGVIRAASDGAVAIYRSGSYRHDPPEALADQLEHDESLSRELLAIDRSALYGSFYVLRVRKTRATRAGVDARRAERPVATVA